MNRLNRIVMIPLLSHIDGNVILSSFWQFVVKKETKDYLELAQTLAIFA